MAIGQGRSEPAFSGECYPEGCPNAPSVVQGLTSLFDFTASGDETLARPAPLSLLLQFSYPYGSATCHAS